MRYRFAANPSYSLTLPVKGEGTKPGDDYTRIDAAREHGISLGRCRVLVPLFTFIDRPQVLIEFAMELAGRRV